MAAAYLGKSWPLRKGWQKEILGCPRDPLEEAPKSWPRKKHGKHHQNDAAIAERAHLAINSYANGIMRDRERLRLIEQQRAEAIAESRRISTKRR